MVIPIMVTSGLQPQRQSSLRTTAVTIERIPMVIPIMVTSGLQPQRQSSLRTTAVTIERQLSGLSQLPNLPTFKKPFKIDLLRAEFRQTHLFAWLVSFIFPHIFLCVGFLFLVVHSRLPSALPPTACLTHNLLTHTQLVHTHNFLTQNLLSHNLLTRNLSIHNLLTHTQLAHTQLVHTQLTLTQLVHTQLTHTHTTCTHTTCTHTHNLLTHNLSTHNHTHTHNLLCVAGVALGDIDLHFAWQAWHLATSTSTLRGRRGTYGTGLGLVACLGPVWRRGRRGCLRGRRGTWRHRRAFCVAGVALGNIDLHSAWQAWHLATGTLGPRLAPWSPAAAGLALGDIDLHFAWQAWHLAISTCILCGRRGTWRRTWAPFGAVGVALGDIDRHFAWQAWHLATSTCILRGRCGTYGTALPSVASVALGDIHLHLATFTFVLRGTWWHPRCKWVHLSQIRLCHTQLCHAQSVTSLSHMRLYRTQLCQTQLFRT